MTVTTLADRRPHDADEVLAAFARAVRAAGVPVTLDRSQAFLRAAAMLGAEEQSGVYWAGRATLCANADELQRYDAVFAAWFSGTAPSLGRARETLLQSRQAPLDDGQDGGDGERSEVVVRAAASSVDVLRHRDVAELTKAERAHLARLFGTLRPAPPERVSARRRPSHRGEVDGRRTLRGQLRNGGEPSALEFRRRAVCSRRVVVLVDVSGSMGPYADSLLRWAHLVTSVNRSRTEVFTIGTRLTRITHELGIRDPDRALDRAAAAVVDWSGGTRIGVSMATLNRVHGRRLGRGSVIVILSDGWDRGDPALLGTEMARLRRSSHRVIWLNPLKASPDYEPLARGMAAALPHTDHFLAGNSLRSLAELADLLEGGLE
jgi:uncharacterized protein with von Willebrand factor type A (vWA) domain